MGPSFPYTRGGFILSSGCSIPPNAKPENVRVMREAVEEYGWY
jgi:uroporphyrinogen-III decarboxylase